MKRYARLLIGVLAAALLVSVLARLPRRARHEPAAPAPPPVAELAIEVNERGITPAVAAVPKGHLVRLTVRNAGRAAVSLRLAGYAAVSIEDLPPDSTWRDEFLAELPGEDFAWLVNGQPAGRLSVTGSHLVEGHR